MKQIAKASELVGKTISATSIDNSDTRGILAFTDGTFAVFESKSGYYGDHSLELADDFDPYEYSRESIKLGIITIEEAQAHIQKREAQAKAAQDFRDAAEYERLRRKFAATPNERTNERDFNPAC